MPARPDLGPPPRLGYTASRIDRAAARRSDNAALAKLAQNERAGFVSDRRRAGADEEAGREISIRCSRLPRCACSALRARPCSSASWTKRRASPIGLDPASGRAAHRARRSDGHRSAPDRRSGSGRDEHLPPLAETKALLALARASRFCPIAARRRRPWRPAGGATARPAGASISRAPIRSSSCWRRRRTLPARPLASLCAANLVVSCRLCRAGRIRSRKPCGAKLREEVGLICGRVNYFASQPWPFPTTLMIGCHAEALSENIVIDRSELEDARRFERDEARC